MYQERVIVPEYWCWYFLVLCQKQNKWCRTTLQASHVHSISEHFLKVYDCGCVPNRTLLHYIGSCQNSRPRYVTIVTIGSLPILLYYARGFGRRQRNLVKRSTTTDSATSNSCMRWNLDADSVLHSRLAGVTHSWGGLDQGKFCTAVLHLTYCWTVHSSGFTL